MAEIIQCDACKETIKSSYVKLKIEIMPVGATDTIYSKLIGSLGLDLCEDCIELVGMVIVDKVKEIEGEK